VPYLIFDRNENKAVRDRIQCVQWIVLLFNNYCSEDEASFRKKKKKISRQLNKRF